MIQALRMAFAVDETCECLCETNAPLIEVYDCDTCDAVEKRCYIRTDDHEPIHFTLHNPLNVNLSFAALDNCLFNSGGPQRCDFLIGNFQKLYFVEIKQVNTSRRHTARASAIEQLYITINFIRNSVNIDATTIIAIICLKAKKIYPVQTATRSAQVVAFKEQLNANLMEGQSDIF